LAVAEAARDKAEAARSEAEEARSEAEEARSEAEEARDKAEEAKERLREQLYAAQKMEAVGRLAGGTAHDMNNILAGIMGYASLLLNDLDAGTQAHADMKSIVALCNRGRDLTTNLLGFARRGQYSRTSIALSETVASVKEVISRTAPKTISIETSIDADLPSIVGDSGQITQVIMNICINAVDAMPMGGRLTITCKKTELLGGMFGLPLGSYVRVDVSDTGVGMDADTISKAMDPFFTTKSPGHGTGLGLSMACGCVEQHGGVLTIDSLQGRGTTVTLFLPASSEKQSADVRHAREESAKLEKMKGVVLLVDDEEAIRATGKRLLELFGFKVLLARDGKEAVDIYAASNQDIAFVILDLIMPVMDGDQTFQELVKIRRDVKVLIASGRSDEETVQRILTSGARGFLQKPYDSHKLRSELLSLGLHACPPNPPFTDSRSGPSSRQD
jgi:signal transduction histidine kinase/ActR/RegA family two-component response regulator